MSGRDDGVVRIVGYPPDSDVCAFEVPLGHGEQPELVIFDQGFAAGALRDAYRDSDGELVAQWTVHPLDGQTRPRQRLRGQDPGLVGSADLEPEIRQRFAAYAVVRSTRGLLATEYSSRTAVAGRWGMPGGGLDDQEQPWEAVHREVAEETSQQIVIDRLVAVQTSHWLGLSPAGRVEDFHAVRFVYTGTCPVPSDPVVADADGTTRSARWVPLPKWRSLNWTVNWHQLLSDQLTG